jgi:hypothetical protein
MIKPVCKAVNNKIFCDYYNLMFHFNLSPVSFALSYH